MGRTSLSCRLISPPRVGSLNVCGAGSLKSGGVLKPKRAVNNYYMHVHILHLLHYPLRLSISIGHFVGFSISHFSSQNRTAPTSHMRPMRHAAPTWVFDMAQRGAAGGGDKLEIRPHNN